MAVYRVEYEIHTYDADATGVATASSLFRFLLDSASIHADTVGYGYRHMKEQAYAWVLSRFLFEADRYPQWQERVVVETWPSGSERLFALRDYLVKDGSGEIIGRATSSWIVIDAEKRTPERLERLPLARNFITEEHVFDRTAGKVAPASEARLARSAEATFSDIDLNGHVTSSRYLDWMLDALPGEFQAAHRLKGFEINYLAETLCGEGVRVMLTEEGGERLAAPGGAGTNSPTDAGTSGPTAAGRGNAGAVATGAPAADAANTGAAATSALAANAGQRAFLHAVERATDSGALCRARTVWLPRANEPRSS